MGCKALHIFNLFRSNNKERTEDIELATTNDRLVGEAWVGHPYYELIDNSTDFETKMRRLCRYFFYRLNCQRILGHYLTGLSLQDYTYLMRKSSCTATPRRGSFWWSARAWSPQWRGPGPGSGTFRSGLAKIFSRLKHFDELHHIYIAGAPRLSALLPQWATGQDQEAWQTWYTSLSQLKRVFQHWIQYPDITFTHMHDKPVELNTNLIWQVSGCTRTLCERRWLGRWWRLGPMSRGRFTTSC